MKNIQVKLQAAKLVLKYVARRLTCFHFYFFFRQQNTRRRCQRDHTIYKTSAIVPLQGEILQDVMSKSDSPFMGVPSMYHVTFGLGSPYAGQCSVSVSLTITSGLSTFPAPSIRAGTVCQTPIRVCVRKCMSATCGHHSSATMSFSW